MQGKDQRLEKAYQLIDEGKIRLLSIDIFDTLIWRKVPTPKDLFIILGEQLHNEGWLNDSISALAFAELRAKAETYARFFKGEGKPAEIFLSEIYWQLHGVFRTITIEQMIAGEKGIINESDIDQLVEIEVALECQLVSIDSNILKLIKAARNKNIKVVLVSNTYFNTLQIDQIIHREQKLHDLIDKLYLSCEYGFNKQQGLLQQMITDFNYSPGEILHIGDDLKADVASAKALNLRFVHYCKLTKELTKVINSEWSEDDLEQRSEMLDRQQGDFGLTSLRSIVSQQAKNENPEFAFWEYGATVLGPMVASFVLWARARTLQLGQKKAYCILREGWLYAEVFRLFSHYLPEQIEPVELWISRRSASFAALSYGSFEEFYTLMTTSRHETFTVGSFCQSLGVELLKSDRLFEQKNLFIKTEMMREQLAAELSKDRAMRDRILSAAAEKRKRFLHYLKKHIDFTNSSNTVMVDVGWTGTIQGAMQKIFAMNGLTHRLCGLYFGVNNAADLARLEGSIREGYLINCGYPYGLYDAVQHGAFVFEDLHQPVLGDLKGYDETGDPIIGEMVIPLRMQRHRTALKEGVFAFCHLLGENIANGTIEWNPFSSSLIRQLQQLFLRSVSNPTRHEAITLGKLTHHFRNEKILSLADEEESKKLFLHRFPRQLFRHSNTLWAVGYAAQVDPSLTLAAQAVICKKLPEQSFLSHDFLTVKVYADTGNGKSKKPNHSLRIQSNANRQFFGNLEIVMTKKNIQTIYLSIGVPNSLVRFKHLSFIFLSRNSSKKSEISCFENNNRDPRLIVANGKELDFSLFQTEEVPLTLSYNFIDAEIYLVEFSLYLEKFEFR